MSAASTHYHEPVEALSDDTRDLHRALVSLQEELEAVDWYQQRADASPDPALRDILLHNMREEVEHACMVLEWLRRHSADFDAQLRTYLFCEGSITEAEESETTDVDAPDAREAHPLRQTTIGSLKGV
ncbi:MAG TPA: ferritin-like domain-containing protein [Gammaproteobacteria bacterium]|nr:ferritin-like domain-containing protein [Gammaproteobacteria bacterium]